MTNIWRIKSKILRKQSSPWTIYYIFFEYTHTHTPILWNTRICVQNVCIIISRVQSLQSYRRLDASPCESDVATDALFFAACTNTGVTCTYIYINIHAGCIVLYNIPPTPVHVPRRFVIFCCTWTPPRHTPSPAAALIIQNIVVPTRMCDPVVVVVVGIIYYDTITVRGAAYIVLCAAPAQWTLFAPVNKNPVKLVRAVFIFLPKTIIIIIIRPRGPLCDYCALYIYVYNIVIVILCYVRGTAERPRTFGPPPNPV